VLCALLRNAMFPATPAFSPGLQFLSVIQTADVFDSPRHRLGRVPSEAFLVYEPSSVLEKHHEQSFWGWQQVCRPDYGGVLVTHTLRPQNGPVIGWKIFNN
jgi:hypothetical protein